LTWVVGAGVNPARAVAIIDTQTATTTANGFSLI
jgi:hypothetical protein